jgi:hypothetical protein
MGSEDGDEGAPKAPNDAPGNGAPDARPTPGIADAFRELGDTGRATWQAGREAATALRILVTADVSLARSAIGRAFALTAVAIMFGASAWLLLMAALIVWLSLGLGWAWSFSLLLTGTLSLLITGLAGWLAMRYFEHTRFKATRRQLARLGIGELSGMIPSADSAKTAEEGAEQVAAATDGGKRKKGLGIDVTPP